MSDDARGDDVYQPVNSGVDNPPDDALDMENALDEPDLDATLDEGYSPPERPYASNDYGTTQNEQHDGESLDRRLARERPEVAPEDGDGIGDLDGSDGEARDDQVGDARTGRIAIDYEDGIRGLRTVAHDVGIDGGAATAEEAAMHTVPDGEIEAS